MQAGGQEIPTPQLAGGDLVTQATTAPTRPDVEDIMEDTTLDEPHRPPLVADNHINDDATTHDAPHHGSTVVLDATLTDRTIGRRYDGTPPADTTRTVCKHAR